MQRYEYEHAFVQHLTNHGQTAGIPIDVAESLNAWGADGWEIVHMEAVWVWQQSDHGACWPEALRGYYVTFRREPGAKGAKSVSAVVAKVPLEDTPL